MVIAPTEYSGLQPPTQVAAQALEPDSAPTTQTPRPKEEVDKEIADTRASAAADGHPLTRPVEARPGAIQGEIDDRVEQIENGTVRITTARFDLTGHPPALVAGDRGKAVGGGVRCTDTVRFAQGQPAIKRPTVLLCWRFSKTRSLVTMMATPKSEPTLSQSMEIFRREWKKLS
ncbi:hypothetical protein Q0Z83_105180 [Actinoplanes sichuanensis]|nr:hypothetical protein Q0Z83_105180 [Actinoplanes sichuanensis]